MYWVLFHGGSTWEWVPRAFSFLIDDKKKSGWDSRAKNWQITGSTVTVVGPMPSGDHPTVRVATVMVKRLDHLIFLIQKPRCLAVSPTTLLITCHNNLIGCLTTYNNVTRGSLLTVRFNDRSCLSIIKFFMYLSYFIFQKYNNVENIVIII